eukprot:CAMPEP_0176447184 /NCGR_PEP_ID=MMETSP0127-20121128/24853_1 /TAXON_ID=938130 /ORGANISM="Platyophrya macrostoma, Strain WH" /LENGTH=139 /DNA_ID=CAMNT_0017833527 /DNA_START=42 /DNA_END=461 /DNA_ORIENTATION=-
MTSQLTVRTARDAELEQREALLRLEFERDDRNPLHKGVVKLQGYALRAYDWLHAPGVLCVASIVWGTYPAFARFRHQNIRRFRRAQVDFRERLFHTKNITKIRVPEENRGGWYYWSIFFFLFRLFQDATEMPEMPRFPI